MKRTEEAEQLAARLRILKGRAGSSFEALAGRTGISRSSLHRYCAGTKFPANYGVIHAFATACGASAEELRELHRLWALADAMRSSSAPSAAPAGRQETGHQETGGVETGGARTPRTLMSPLRTRPRVRLPLVVSAVTACIAAAAAAFLTMLDTDRKNREPTITQSGPGTAPTTIPVRVFNIEGDCKSREERVPACSMGLARDPRLKYDTDNVVSHRVWHDDILNADCVLYDGDRVEDETGVGTTRWFRVRIDTVPGGSAWLPAVRTHDSPALPTCA